MPKTKEVEVRIASGTGRKAKGQSTPASTRQFLAFIKSEGQDEQGRHVGANGIKWRVA